MKCNYDNCNGYRHEKVPEWLSEDIKLKIILAQSKCKFISEMRYMVGYICPVYFKSIGKSL